MSIHKVMKPYEVAYSEINAIKYPVYVSPILTGIKFIIKKGRVLSSSLKQITNLDIQVKFGNPVLNNFEGEVTVGNPVDKDVFHKTFSLVKTRHQKEDMLDKITLYVYDISIEGDKTYKERYDLLQKMSENFPSGVVLLEQTLVYNVKELLDYNAWALNKGSEGIMIRSPNAKYKFGQSTFEKSEFMKLRIPLYSDATIIKVNGYKCNSKLISSITVRDNKTKIEFGISRGFTDHERRVMLSNKEDMIGKVIRYKYNKSSGYIKPRFPVYISFINHDIFEFPKREIIEMFNS